MALNVNGARFPCWINRFHNAPSHLQNTCHVEMSGYVQWTISGFGEWEQTRDRSMIISCLGPSSLKDIFPSLEHDRIWVEIKIKWFSNFKIKPQMSGLSIMSSVGFTLQKGIIRGENIRNTQQFLKATFKKIYTGSLSHLN